MTTLKSKRVAERRREKKDEAERRRDVIIEAIESRLTEEAREALESALEGIASEYSYTINNTIEEAEREMLDSLEALAKTWGWALVDAAGEVANIELDNSVATCPSDASKYAHTYDACYSAEDEFASLDTHIEAANLRLPAAKEEE